MGLRSCLCGRYVKECLRTRSQATCSSVPPGCVAPAEQTGKRHVTVAGQRSQQQIKGRAEKTLEVFTVIRKAFPWCCDLISDITVTTTVALHCTEGGTGRPCEPFVTYYDCFPASEKKKKRNKLRHTVPPLAVTNKVHWGSNALVKYIVRHLNRCVIFLCKKIKYASQQHSQGRVFRIICRYPPVHMYTARARCFLILLAWSTSLPSALTPSKTWLLAPKHFPEGSEPGGRWARGRILKRGARGPQTLSSALEFPVWGICV